MKKILIGAGLLAGIAVGATGLAVAQTPPGGGGNGPGSAGPGAPPDMDGFGWGHHGPGRMGPPGPHGMGHGMMGHPPRAAMFAINRGDTRIMIKCSDQESTRACVDAASSLLDKVGGGAATAR